MINNAVVTRGSSTQAVRVIWHSLRRLVCEARQWDWRPAARKARHYLQPLLLLAALAALCRLFLFPAPDPRHSWVPPEWGKPWRDGEQPWAVQAAVRKAELAALSTNSTSIRQQPPGSYAGARPVRLKYPVLWAAPFFARSGEGPIIQSYLSTHDLALTCLCALPACSASH